MQWRSWNTGCQLNAYILQNPTSQIMRNPDWYGVAFLYLDDSASDPYRAESNGGQQNENLL
jgi:hypothetical protein